MYYSQYDNLPINIYVASFLISGRQMTRLKNRSPVMQARAGMKLYLWDRIQFEEEAERCQGISHHIADTNETKSRHDTGITYTNGKSGWPEEWLRTAMDSI